MLFSVTGPGGSGKSTTIDYLKNQYGYNIIDRKTSRSILSDWGVTTAEVNANPELTCKFQLEILKRKLDDEKHAAESDQIWITERTTADLFVYAIYSLGRLNAFSNFVSDYHDQCRDAMDRYVGIIYLRGGQFPVVDDGVRTANEHYTQMTDQSMWELTQRWAKDRVITITGREGDWRYPIITGNIGKMACEYKLNQI